MIRETGYGYLTKKAKTLRTLEYFIDSPDKNPDELKAGKRRHEDIVKVTVIVEKI